MISVERVVQEFRSGFFLSRVRVLDEVSFVVPQGSVFGFLGANGAGKTTLIQLMAGIKSPTSGRISVSGYVSTDRRARAKLGYLPERPYFYSHLTAEKFLRFYAKLAGLGPETTEKRIQETLAVTGMEQARTRELGKYSKGMLQRMGIAQAILHEPDLLILDEPMSGLDPVGRREIRDLVSSIAATGKTVFFSSHVISDVEALCDRVALIQRGKLQGEGSIDQLLRGGSEAVEIHYRREVKGIEGATRVADYWSVVASDSAEANTVVGLILKGKGELLRVKPQRRSLEDLFGAQRGGGL